MPTTTFKVLGQTITTAAPANTVVNLITDPIMDGLGTTTTTATTLNVPQTISGTSTKFWIGTSLSNVTIGGGISVNSTYGSSLQKYEGTNSLAIRNSSGGAIDAGYIYGQTGRQGITAAGTSDLTSTTDAIPVTGNTTYYYGAYVALIADGSRTYNMRVTWYTSTGVYIQANSSTTALTADAWNKMSSNATSPSTAGFAVFQIYGALSNGARSAIDAIWFGTSSSIATTFPTPSVLTDTTLLTAPFTSRGTNVWSGTPYASTTINASAGALTDLYTVPSSTQAVVSTVTVSNLSTTAGRIRLLVLPSGQTAGKKNFIVFDTPIGANSTEAYSLGITLNAGDKLQVASDTDNVSATAFGSEIS